MRLEDPDPTRIRLLGFSKAALLSGLLLPGSTSPKQPFVATRSRPEADVTRAKVGISGSTDTHMAAGLGIASYRSGAPGGRWVSLRQEGQVRIFQGCPGWRSRLEPLILMMQQPRATIILRRGGSKSYEAVLSISTTRRGRT